MQLPVIQSPPYQITLCASNEGLEAKLKSAKREIHFTKEQISWGILGDDHQEVLTLEASKIAAFAFPKANPTELWLFEAVPMAAAAIRQGKEYLKQAEYKKALQQFKTALKIQKSQKGNLSDLEQAICCIQKKQLIFKCRQKARLYLPNAKELERFETVLNTYQEQDDLYACFQTLVAIEDQLLSHHSLMAAIVYEKQKQWQEAIKAYLRLADHNPHALNCIQKAYSLLDKAQWLDRQAAVRMAFEKTLIHLSMASSVSSPTCFICYNAEEEDVRGWLENSLIPDLDLAGIQSLIGWQQLGPGQDLSHFHELARHADLVIIACTPELKIKYEARKKVPVGLAQEIRLIKERYKERAKADTIFPLILKGTREESIPTPSFEPIFSAMLSIEPCAFHYFTHAFELFAAMRKVPSAKARKLCEEFIQDVKPILRGQLDSEELMHWQIKRKKRKEGLFNTTRHRVTQLSKHIHLPSPPRDFTGRKEELLALDEACRHSQRVAITGLGGVGKTALALQYANDYQWRYSFIHFLEAGTLPLVMQGLLQLADDLFVPRSDKMEERLTWLKTALDQREQDYLLIFDGMDQADIFSEIEKYLPQRGRCLLVTSRLPEKCKRLEFKENHLQPLQLQDAIEYLLTALGSQEGIQAQALAEELGRLPLALKHAVSYMRNRHYSIQKYRDQFARFQLQLFDSQQLDLGPAEKTILTTWNMSLEAITNIHHCSFAKELLTFLAFLGQAPIPLSFIEDWFKMSHAKGEELKLSNALRYLCDYSLLTSPLADTYNIHLLVQQVIRHQTSPEARSQSLKQALRLCLLKIQDLDLANPQMRRKLAPFMPHFKAIAEQALTIGDVLHLIELLEKIWVCDYHDGRYLDLEQTARKCLTLSQSLQEPAKEMIYLDRLGMSLQQMGRYEEAFQYHKQALETGKNCLENEHPLLATFLNNLATSLQELGEYREALCYQQQNLAFRQKTLGNKHADTAVSSNRVGSVLLSLGNYSEALKYFEQALAIRKELGEEHTLNIALSFNNIGTALSELGQFQNALTYKEQALTLTTAILGQEHPTVATSLNNLGSIWLELGEYEKALQYQRQALTYRKALLGERHPDCATSFNNIGICLWKLGKHEEAQHYYEKALDIWKELLGESHPDIALVFNSLGYSLWELGRYEEALTYQRQALKINQARLGDKHPHVALTLNNMGLTLWKLGKNQEAFTYQMQALKLKQELLGHQHPCIVASLGSVGLVLFTLKRFAEALNFQKQALELSRKIFGNHHPDVATSLHNMGITLCELGQHRKSLDYLRQALELRRKLFGEKHPSVAASLDNLGSTLLALGQHEEALASQRQGLELRKLLFFKDQHPAVATSLNHIGVTLLVSDKQEEALDYLLQGLKIRKQLFGEKHPDVATSLNNIGLALGKLNKHLEALRYFFDALKMEEEILGKGHPDVARTLNRIGMTYSRLGCHKAALSNFLQAATINKKFFGENHLIVAADFTHIGRAYNALGLHQQALPYLILAVQIRQKVLEKDHPELLISLTELNELNRKLEN